MVREIHEPQAIRRTADMCHSDRRPNGRGFSLMEVLLALVVIAFGLYGILDLMASTQRLSLRAQRRAVAIELAGAKMAEIQAGGFEAVEALWSKSPAGLSQPFHYPTQPAKFGPPYVEQPAGRRAKAGPSYDVNPFLWRARFDHNDRQPEVFNVEVRVYWYPTATAPVDTIQEHSVSVGGFLVKR